MATQTTRAVFNGAQPLDGDFPYVDITFATPYASAASYEAFPGQSLSDGYGPVPCCIKAASKTASGCRVLALAQWSGDLVVITVDV